MNCPPGSPRFHPHPPWLNFESAPTPVAFELLQHVVEVRIGMYDSLAAAQAVEDSPMRTAFGLLKVASLPAYWVMRFLPRRDARFAARVESPRGACSVCS